MRSFAWVDGERTIHFGPAGDAVAPLGGPGYTLLTTPRAAAAAPRIAARRRRGARGRAAARSTSWRAALLATVRGDRIVALGGGRVVDVAKALAAAARAGVAPGNVAPGRRGAARWPCRPRCRARR